MESTNHVSHGWVDPRSEAMIVHEAHCSSWPGLFTVSRKCQWLLLCSVKRPDWIPGKLSDNSICCFPSQFLRNTSDSCWESSSETMASQLKWDSFLHCFLLYSCKVQGVAFFHLLSFLSSSTQQSQTLSVYITLEVGSPRLALREQQRWFSKEGLPPFYFLSFFKLQRLTLNIKRILENNLKYQDLNPEVSENLIA